jgi:hypothetical protein
MQTLGFTTKSKYHLYSNVAKEVSKNNYMFAKTGKGLYRLREAFRGIRPEKLSTREHINFTEDIPSLRDIVIHFAKEYQTENGTKPFRVWNIMNLMGLKCSYSSVYRCMQNIPCEKKDGWYQFAI